MKLKTLICFGCDVMQIFGETDLIEGLVYYKINFDSTDVPKRVYCIFINLNKAGVRLLRILLIVSLTFNFASFLA